AAGRTISWARALSVNIPFYYLWALLTPLLIHLARRFPLARPVGAPAGGRPGWVRWCSSLAAHVVIGAALAAVQLVVANALLFPADFLRARGSGFTPMT